MNLIRFSLFIFFISSVLSSLAQSPDSLLNLSTRLPGKYYSQVDNKISSINDHLLKKSLKYLAKFQRQERKLREKLQKLNPELLINNANEKYNDLAKKIKSKTSGLNKIAGGEYNPYLDSLGTSLSFLKQFNGISAKVKEPLESFNQLQSKLQLSEKIKEFIVERKNQIKELLSKYAKLPLGLKKEYDKLRQTAIYYQMQLQEYKNMLKDNKKIEQKALGILNKLPAFQKFMKENSQLASLFRIPNSSSLAGGQAAALTGLQTRSSVQSLIQQRIAAGGPNAQAQIQANLAAAHIELNKLKDKLNAFGGGSNDVEMPEGFRVNPEKTKSFLKRLEYSTDLQFSKTNNLLPSTADIGLGIGYKLDDKKIIGIGMNYKMGMGSIQHINITHQGLGFRSYMDWKIKKQFFISGGYETNYYPAYNRVSQISPPGGDLEGAAWQRSALVGVSKKYKINKKVKGEMKILYDFLANQHIPVSQAVVFRLGYKF